MKRIIQVVKVDDADFDYVEIAYFGRIDVAEDFINGLEKKLDWTIIDYGNDMYGVALKYKQKIYFAGAWANR